MTQPPVISLVRPRYRSHLITPPLGLGYLSSFMKSKGYATRIIDGLNQRLSAAAIVEQCKGSLLVGISALTAYLSEVVALTAALKKEGHCVVIGGPHASALPAETLKTTGADFVIVGEGERTLAELAQALERGESPDAVPGVATQQHPVPSLERALTPNLDDLPFPDWKA